MEMADALVINKADGDNVKKAERARQEYKNALHLFPPSESGWIPSVNTCSSLNNTGIREIWDVITQYREMSQENGYFDKRRQDQELKIFHESIGERLKHTFYHDPGVKARLEEYKSNILEGKISSYQAGIALLELFYDSIRKETK